MIYKSTLIAVADIEKSKTWYHDVLGLNVVYDFGANVLLTGGLSLQKKTTWQKFIGRKEIVWGNNAFELFFEEDDIDTFVERLRRYREIEYVHLLIEHRWGQRVIRFYDPDRYIIEVGEPMAAVVQRFVDRGMSEEETASKMDVPLGYVKQMMQEYSSLVSSHQGTRCDINGHK